MFKNFKYWYLSIKIVVNKVVSWVVIGRCSAVIDADVSRLFDTDAR